jgi:hypothetical protein
MAKLTAWLVTIIGILLVIDQIKPMMDQKWFGWLIALLVLIVGVGKLMRNYNSHHK